MSQAVQRLTPDFGSGHGHVVCGFEPHSGLCTDSWQSLLGISLSPSLFAPPPLELAPSLSQKIKTLRCFF